MSKQNDDYTGGEQRHPAPNSITMTNDQLQLMITGIVNGLVSTQNEQSTSTGTKPGKNSRNQFAIPDKSVRAGGVSPRPVKADFTNLSGLTKRKSSEEINKLRKDNEGKLKQQK